MSNTDAANVNTDVGFVAKIKCGNEWKPIYTPPNGTAITQGIVYLADSADRDIRAIDSVAVTPHALISAKNEILSEVEGKLSLVGDGVIEALENDPRFVKAEQKTSESGETYYEIAVPIRFLKEVQATIAGDRTKMGYGICDTASDETVKYVTILGYPSGQTFLNVGDMIIVNFNNGNDVDLKQPGVVMNMSIVNDAEYNTPMPIKFPGSSVFGPNAFVTMVYDGSRWIVTNVFNEEISDMIDKIKSNVDAVSSLQTLINGYDDRISAAEGIASAANSIIESYNTSLSVVNAAIDEKQQSINQIQINLNNAVANWTSTIETVNNTMSGVVEWRDGNTQVFDENGDPVLDDDGNPTYTGGAISAISSLQTTVSQNAAAITSQAQRLDTIVDSSGNWTETYEEKVESLVSQKANEITLSVKSAAVTEMSSDIIDAIGDALENAVDSAVELSGLSQAMSDLMSGSDIPYKAAFESQYPNVTFSPSRLIQTLKGIDNKVTETASGIDILKDRLRFYSTKTETLSSINNLHDEIRQEFSSGIVIDPDQITASVREQFGLVAEEGGYEDSGSMTALDELIDAISYTRQSKLQQGSRYILGYVGVGEEEDTTLQQKIQDDIDSGIQSITLAVDGKKSTSTYKQTEDGFQFDVSSGNYYFEKKQYAVIYDKTNVHSLYDEPKESDWKNSLSMNDLVKSPTYIWTRIAHYTDDSVTYDYEKELYGAGPEVKIDYSPKSIVFWTSSTYSNPVAVSISPYIDLPVNNPEVSVSNIELIEMTDSSFGNEQINIQNKASSASSSTGFWYDTTTGKYKWNGSLSSEKYNVRAVYNASTKTLNVYRDSASDAINVVGQKLSLTFKISYDNDHYTIKTINIPYNIFKKNTGSAPTPYEADLPYYVFDEQTLTNASTDTIINVAAEMTAPPAGVVNGSEAIVVKTIARTKNNLCPIAVTFGTLSGTLIYRGAPVKSYILGERFSNPIAYVDGYWEIQGTLDVKEPISYLYSATSAVGDVVIKDSQSSYYKTLVPNSAISIKYGESPKIAVINETITGATANTPVSVVEYADKRFTATINANGSVSNYGSIGDKLYIVGTIDGDSFVSKTDYNANTKSYVVNPTEGNDNGYTYLELGKITSITTQATTVKVGIYFDGNYEFYRFHDGELLTVKNIDIEIRKNHESHIKITKDGLAVGQLRDGALGPNVLIRSEEINIGNGEYSDITNLPNPNQTGYNLYMKLSKNGMSNYVDNKKIAEYNKDGITYYNNDSPIAEYNDSGITYYNNGHRIAEYDDSGISYYSDGNKIADYTPSGITYYNNTSAPIALYDKAGVHLYSNGSKVADYIAGSMVLSPSAADDLIYLQANNKSISLYNDNNKRTPIISIDAINSMISINGNNVVTQSTLNDAMSDINDNIDVIKNDLMSKIDIDVLNASGQINVIGSYFNARDNEAFMNYPDKSKCFVTKQNAFDIYTPTGNSAVSYDGEDDVLSIPSATMNNLTIGNYSFINQNGHLTIKYTG